MPNLTTTDNIDEISKRNNKPVFIPATLDDSDSESEISLCKDYLPNNSIIL